MNWQQYLLIGGAAVLALWPQVSSLVAAAMKGLRPKPLLDAPPSYAEAMIALAIVRERLEETGGVPEDAGHAIEVITHALVEGSGR